jgi:type III secretory pathway component EscT
MAKKEIHHEEHVNNPFIAIPSSLAGIFLVIVIMFLIFANGSLDILVDLIWGFVALGVVAMAFSYQSTKRKSN